MAWTTDLARHVRRDVRQRGLDYYHRGAVEILDGDDWFVSALVQGTEAYHVALERTRKAIKVLCDCPYCSDRLEPCKHIWATVLAAEKAGLLRGANHGAVRSLRLDPELESFWNDGESEEDEDGYTEEWQQWDEPHVYQPSQPRPPKPTRPRSSSRRAAAWKPFLNRLRQQLQSDAPAPRGAWPAGRELLYIVDVATTLAQGELSLEVAYRQRKQNGEWSKPIVHGIPQSQLSHLPDPEDRQILSLLLGARRETPYTYGYSYYSNYDTTPTRHRLTHPLQEALLPHLCQTGRCFLRVSADAPELRPLRWDDGAAWQFWLEVRPEEGGKRYLVTGSLRRDSERAALAEPRLLVAGGLVFWEDRAARFDDSGVFKWIVLLRQQGTLAVPAADKDRFLQELLGMPRLPRLDLPEELRFEEVTPTPRPRLKVLAPARNSWGPERLRGELAFDYDGSIVLAGHAGQTFYQPEPRRLVRRDQAAEDAAAALLYQLGFREGYNYYDRSKYLQLTPRNLPKVVNTLTTAGWHVEAEGKVYRMPGAFRIEVKSGIDWFELHGGVQFGDTEAPLPELLAALRRGENTVRLGDGTYGMLPQDWLKKYGMLAGLGTAAGDHLRFRPTQVGVLDALLAAQPEATCDAVFARARDELHRFAGVEPFDPPAGFVGQLRGYQREGLGWLAFLQKFGFGGCLADDMGLGKTVQVLALLETRRTLRASARKDRPPPSLVVVPKSLVFNWKQEAARFTPELRVLDHTGITRLPPGRHFDDYDVILTTYGTLRRDAVAFKDRLFDYCILDEAQAVKNANTASAKAVRLIRADHRLVMSGTPVENHLGELWSLFEFLNPGMLGSASVFRLGAGGRNLDAETAALLARALRPFILRRTKEQVARDLPQKLEQTLFCELEPAQRKRYDELREHFRRDLLGRVDRDGLNRSKMQILEALLRLRQAACHPGLIDKAKTAEPSAKLDALLPQLAEVLDEGHKALVFSQFTSFLAIVRSRLDQDGVTYEYLDGRTRDRAARVERFQNDPDCKLFLVSLKAGGLGLNLTAAEYVFLLDPWWNPAVEAQAIDRTHRIGQTRPVFAYRLIARDTVEEKVLELQKTKRALADAIINADNSLIRTLGREDLELLLS